VLSTTAALQQASSPSQGYITQYDLSGGYSSQYSDTRYSPSAVNTDTVHKYSITQHSPSRVNTNSKGNTTNTLEKVNNARQLVNTATQLVNRLKTTNTVYTISGGSKYIRY
jgi:hypothetical protein